MVELARPSITISRAPPPGGALRKPRGARKNTARMMAMARGQCKNLTFPKARLAEAALGRWGRGGGKNCENFVKKLLPFSAREAPKNLESGPGTATAGFPGLFCARGLAESPGGARFGGFPAGPGPESASWVVCAALEPAGPIFSASIFRIPGVSGFGRLPGGSGMPYCCGKPRREPGRPDFACLPSKKCGISICSKNVK